LGTPGTGLVTSTPQPERIDVEYRRRLFGLR